MTGPVPYDRIADRYVEARRGFRERRYVEALVRGSSGTLEVLDLGCGTGVPIARQVVEWGHHVTGVDISSEMLRRARRNLPDARLLRGDIRTIGFAAGSFDRIIAWDSLFHIDREEHARIYRRCFGWLKPGGRALLSCGGSAWEGTAEMFGEEFFFSGHAPARTRALLEQVGFQVDLWEVDDPSSRGHVAVLVRRPTGAGDP